MYKLDGKAIIGMLKGDDGIDEVAESFGGYGRVASGELLKCKRLGLRDRDMSALKFFLFFWVTPHVLLSKKGEGAFHSLFLYLTAV